MNKKAIFLDRDGTVIEDTGYIKNPALVRLLPNVGESLARLHSRGFLLVLVSNQSGIGRGLITPLQAVAVHHRMCELLKEYDVGFDKVCYCPHLPEEHCICRKPSPYMLLSAALTLNIDITRSFMIGDKASDIAAGKAAGCTTIRLCKDLVSYLDLPLPCWSATEWLQIVDYLDKSFLCRTCSC